MANSHNSRPNSHNSNEQFIENVCLAFTFVCQLAKELITGILEFRAAFWITLFSTIFVRAALLHRWDESLIGGTDWAFLYPKKAALYNLYYYWVVTLPTFLWGSIRVVKKRNYRNEMDHLFQASGVTNRVGQAPKPVQSFKTHDGTNVLRVSAKGISLDDFKKSKGALEQSLRANVEGFEPNIAKGTIDIRYTRHSTPSEFSIDGGDIRCLKEGEFIVGQRASRLLRAMLSDVPHILIAGETGSGKSTFLRQFISGLYLNDSNVQLLLMDLKAGLEFHIFRHLPRVSIVTDLDAAITAILALDGELTRRFALLERNQCRDIESYNRKEGQTLSRHVVVVDEVAELFLPYRSKSDNGLERAQGILNRIARQGRAIGVHLIVATQRPDTRSLDSQIKANMSGVLCFPMVNDASSISVLGTGKATELPHIKGRAIWKVGAEMEEVQTPYLNESETKEMLQPHRTNAASQWRQVTTQEQHRYEPLK